MRTQISDLLKHRDTAGKAVVEILRYRAELSRPAPGRKPNPMKTALNGRETRTET